MKYVGQAFLVLLRKYATVFRHAWRHRSDGNRERKLPHELQFLPAALALRDTPVSPVPRLAMWIIILFFTLALIWAIFGKIDVVSTAHGKIVPNDRTKLIQPVETAKVKAIHVNDGEEVRAGDLLIELEETEARANRESTLKELARLKLEVARDRAMLAYINSASVPSIDLADGYNDEDRVQAELLLKAQYEEYVARVSRLKLEVEKRHVEEKSVMESVLMLEQKTPLVRRQAEDYKNLVDQRYVSEHGYFEKEQALLEAESQLAIQKLKLDEVKSALSEAEARLVELKAETKHKVIANINENTQKIGLLEQEEKKTVSRLTMTRLTAPVDGTVQQLAIHTIGGVVTSAQPLMVIVPRNDLMEIEAFIENKDIGFVKVGQIAEVKVETFQFTKYGTVPATVTSISHDAISDEKLGLVYSMKAKMDGSSIDVDGVAVNLTPGMAVTVEIKTGKRRLIEYFLSPFLQHASESLQER